MKSKKRRIIEKTLRRYFKTYEIKNIVDKSWGTAVRYIVFVETENVIYVLKIYSQDLGNQASVFAYNIYSKLLNQNNILTPEIIPDRKSNVCDCVELDNAMYIYWMEQYISSKYIYPDLIPTYDMPSDIFYEIGAVNGKMHLISSENKGICDRDIKTMIGFSEEPFDSHLNAVKDITAFFSETKYFSEIEKISKIYFEKRQRLKSVYSGLDKGYIQGDFSPLNLIVSEDNRILGLYDYNLSGNDVYIAEAISNALFYAFEYNHSDYFTDKDKFSLAQIHFSEYLKGYLDCFNQNCDSEVFDLIYNILSISKPFKMIHIKRAYDEKNYSMVEYILNWMMDELTRTDILKYYIY